MAKESGIGMTVSIDDAGGNAQNVTNDITSWNFGTPRNVQDVTGLDKSSMERLLLLGDAQFSGTAVFNDGTNAIFDVLKTAGTSDNTRTVTTAISGQTLTCECVLTDVQYQRAASGEFTVNFTLQLANGTDPTWS